MNDEQIDQFRRGADAFGHNPAGETPTEKFARVEHEHLNIEDKGEKSKT